MSLILVIAYYIGSEYTMWVIFNLGSNEYLHCHFFLRHKRYLKRAIESLKEDSTKCSSCNILQKLFL